MLGEWCIEVPDSSNAILPRQPAPSASGQQAYSAGSTVGAPATPGSMIPGSFPGGPFMPGIAPGGEYYLRVRESLKRRSLDKYTVADLPFALNNNECGNIPLPFNPRASVAIQNRTEVMSVAARCGVFNPLRKYKISPLTAMPRNGKEFRELGSKNLASFQTGGVFNGLDVVISQFRVPIGLDGILTNVISQFTGTGHVEGSGDIVWRVLLNNHFARNLGLRGNHGRAIRLTGER